MFNKKSSRHSLALFVALGSGTLLAAPSVNAADVSGNDVTIDDTHAPSDNAISPHGGHSFGTAAGFIGTTTDSGNVTNNTLTFNGRPGSTPYNKRLFGGLAFGTGNVTGNHVTVNPATGMLLSTADEIFGSVANGGGNVEDNHAVFNGNQLNGDLVGGMAKDGGTGIVKGNTATLKGGSAHANIYGGMAAGGANGDVIGRRAAAEHTRQHHDYRWSESPHQDERRPGAHPGKIHRQPENYLRRLSVRKRDGADDRHGKRRHQHLGRPLESSQHDDRERDHRRQWHAHEHIRWLDDRLRLDGGSR